MTELLERLRDSVFGDSVAVGGRIVLILVLAVVVRSFVHRAVHRAVRQFVEGVPNVLRPFQERIGVDPVSVLSERRRQRAETVGSVLRSIATFGIFAVAGAMVLSELGLDLRPVIASAGILGVAVGFGAQNLIKDFLTGIFMIVEDQYGVGDVIDAGPASGVVEAVGLRSTRLRSVDGTVWYIRNGEINRVGNMSQSWSRALLDIPVAWDTDIPTAREVVKQVADSVWQDPEWSDRVLEEPEVWGVEALGSDGVVIRLVVKTAPLEQWNVSRELRQRMKAAFDAGGIEIGVPRQTLITTPLREAPLAAPAPASAPGLAAATATAPAAATATAPAVAPPVAASGESDPAPPPVAATRSR